MTTAPSERRNATGMLPCAGGFRGAGLPAVSFASGPPGALAGPGGIEIPAADERGIAAIRPRAAAPLSNSLLFIRSLLSRASSIRSSCPKLPRRRSRLETAAIARGRDPEAALEGPSKGVGASKPDGRSGLLDRPPGRDQTLPRFVQAKRFHKRCGSAPEGNLEPPTEVSRAHV